MSGDQDRRTHCGQTFQEIDSEDWVSVSPSKNPRHIRRPNIAASRLADIDPCETASEVTGRDRPEQVTNNQDGGKCEHLWAEVAGTPNLMF
jgi:hypothetical protein